jgi:hypothetical protein
MKERFMSQETQEPTLFFNLASVSIKCREAMVAISGARKAKEKDILDKARKEMTKYSFFSKNIVQPTEEEIKNFIIKDDYLAMDMYYAKNAFRSTFDICEKIVTLAEAKNMSTSDGKISLPLSVASSINSFLEKGE